VGLEGVTPVPASTDASFRRYFRVNGTTSLIVMDAPPPQEDCRPFVQIAAYLESMGLNAPRVLEADLDRGYLLLSDLGSKQYLTEMELHPQTAESLYGDAIDALLRLQDKGGEFRRKLPLYGEKLLRIEMSLFHDWLCQRYLSLQFSDVDETSWRACCDDLQTVALAQSSVFVHRDYHSRNLMFIDNDNPGILDFQDAVDGPLTYDLVSLLKDCYVKWPEEQTNSRLKYFYARSPIAATKDFSEFQRDFDLMGVQRHLKAAGIFARLCMRDGKSGYLQDIPRTLSYIVDIAPRYAELEFLGELIALRVLPAIEAKTS